MFRHTLWIAHVMEGIKEASAPARDRFEQGARMARGLGSADLLAQAALGAAGCGSLWSVDPPLVNMLSEALEAVGEHRQRTKGVEHMPTLAAFAETVLASTGHDHRT